jgi:hypothetical protein
MAMIWGGFIFMFLFPLLMLGLLALVFIVAAGGMGWIRGVSATGLPGAVVQQQDVPGLSPAGAGRLAGVPV